MKASALVKHKETKTELESQASSSLASSRTSSSFGSFVPSSCLLSTGKTVRGGTFAHFSTVSSHSGSSSISESTQLVASVTSSQQEDSAFQGGFQKASTLYLATRSAKSESDHEQSTTSSSCNSRIFPPEKQKLPGNIAGSSQECAASSSKSDIQSSASSQGYVATQQKTPVSTMKCTAQPTQKITYFFERFVEISTIISLLLIVMS